MGRLSVDQVQQAASSLSARASTAIDTLEGRKSYFGGLTGNNDTVSSTQGALRMIRDTQIPQWQDSGLAIAQNEDDSRVDGWLSVGQDFAKAISEIDGWGQDATLASVAKATIQQTTTDIKDKVVPALSFGFGAVGALALIALGLYVVFSVRRAA